METSANNKMIAKMIRFAHIINPVKVSEDRDLYFAQPVTFESFKLAKEFAAAEVNVDHFTTQFEEDREIIPDHIKILDNLDRSIMDEGVFTYKLPFIKDILDRVYENSNADYMIYSDSDIALMPYFYTSVKKMIEDDYDAIIINRRDITADRKDLQDLPYMWAQVGCKHPGWDCYVFKRELYSNFNLGKTIVGAVGDGRVMQSNLMYHSKKFIELEDAHLTFHLGLSPRGTTQYSDHDWIKVNLHNDKQLEMILNEMIRSANGKDVKWVHRRLENIERRRKRYNEGLYGAKRYPGYWFLKKIKAPFNKVT